jgi:hypothetical protein
MAEILPINFPIVKDPNIISYNWTDVSDGTGMVDFYLNVSAVPTPVYSYILQQQAMVSSNTDFSVTTDTDFDLSPFNKPQEIGGKGYITGWGYYTSGAGVNLIFTLYKVSGGVETAITSVGLETISITSGNKGFMLAFDVTNTRFKVGDILRLTIKKTGGTGYFVIDPHQDVYSDPSLMISVPFRIE